MANQPTWGQSNLQLIAAPKQQTGTNIGGVAPNAAGMIANLPVSPTAILFYTQGCSVADGYADVEWGYLPQPLLPAPTGNLTLSFKVTLGATAAQYAQALEVDTLIVDAEGNKYDLSSQLNFAEGGHFQIDKAGGGWVDTGIDPGILAPGIEHEITVAYQVDFAAKTCSVVSYSLDGTLSDIPLALQNCPAKPTSPAWEAGLYLQVQMDSNQAAAQANAGWTVILDEVEWTAW